MKGLPSELERAYEAHRKQGFMLEREYIEQISAEWHVKPSSVKHALRQGAGNRFFKHRIRTTKMRRMYFFVDPISARKWLAFALDRILVEAQKP